MQTECEHKKIVPAFDLERAKTMSAAEVRKTFPRAEGERCPDCGWMGIMYASWEHYRMGDY